MKPIFSTIGVVVKDRPINPIAENKDEKSADFVNDNKTLRHHHSSINAQK